MNANHEGLLKNVKNEFPESPGVYIFKNSDKIIYIGKAKNLKKRIMSYFTKNGGPKASKIVEEAEDIDYIVVNSEKEALLLEANLIFKEKPLYNTMLKETRWYPYILITSETFPSIKIAREKNEEGEYYGPYTDVGFVRKLLKVAHKIFKIRSCSVSIDTKKPRKPCLEYHLGMCSAPCAGKIDEDTYNLQVQKLHDFLNGKIEGVVKELEIEMGRLSKALEFERAANIRDLIFKIKELFEPQYVVLPKNLDMDVIFLRKGVATILRIRKGILFGKLAFEFQGKINDFLEQLYFGLKLPVPDYIIVNSKIKNEVKTFFSNKYIGQPTNNYEVKIMELAHLNWKEEYKKIKDSENALNKLKEVLGLKHLPRRIEGIDISHTQGLLTVASLVVFVDGKPQKSEYRRYRFNNLDYPDDYQAIKNTILRRYKNHELPDLIFIDGGKGQVNSAVEALKELRKNCPVVGIAKENEKIVFPGNKEDLELPLDDISLRLLISIRDEAHRFANKFHSSLREKKLLKSKLDDIPGIGPKRRKELLKKFGSIEKIKKASIEELRKVIRSEKLAILIKKELK